jgi:aminoglycoside phosphotransferase (APT) family kinase protein
VVAVNDPPAATPPASRAAAAAAVVTHAAGAALGRPVRLAGDPEPVPIGFGRNAFACRLAGIDAAPWSQELVVHVCAGPAAAGREAAWHAWADGQGFPVARVLAAWREGPYGVVLARPGLESSAARMIADPWVMPEVVGSLGRLHARLHAQPVADAPGPVLDWATALDRLDARIARAAAARAGADRPASPQAAAEAVGLGEQRAWLAAHDPGPVAPVPCHGEFTPVNVHVDPQDPLSAVVTCWSAATLCDREYDLALSELAFWTAAYLSPDGGHRAMLERARAHMLDGYTAGYRATGGASDRRRLEHWGAYHACSWSALAVTFSHRPPFRSLPEEWDGVDSAAALAAYRADVAGRFDRLATSVEAAPA